eukprot:GAHX01001497.1.p1 GENE.GAHX01001497.1~~GAHX01001497.1.p1  ORF type:complete len:1331 (-),score=326.64 GAHX01001497.1:122-4114(-)
MKKIIKDFKILKGEEAAKREKDNPKPITPLHDWGSCRASENEVGTHLTTQGSIMGLTQNSNQTAPKKGKEGLDKNCAAAGDIEPERRNLNGKEQNLPTLVTPDQRKKRIWTDINVASENVGDLKKAEQGELEMTEAENNLVLKNKPQKKKWKKTKENGKLQEESTVKESAKNGRQPNEPTTIPDLIKKNNAAKAKGESEITDKNIETLDETKATVKKGSELKRAEELASKGKETRRKRAKAEDVSDTDDEDSEPHESGKEEELAPEETERKKPTRILRKVKNAVPADKEKTYQYKNLFEGKRKTEQEKRSERRRAIIEDWKSKAKEAFELNLKEVELLEINERKRTTKVPEQKVKPLLLKAINELIKEKLKDKTSLKEINELIYAGQLTYTRLTSKKTNFPNSVGHLEDAAQYEANEKKKELASVNNILNQVRLSPEEKKLKRELEELRRNGLAEMKEDLKSQVYEIEKKLNGIKIRKQYATSNRMFELSRATFYRKLREKNGEGIEANGEVNPTEVLAFWKDLYKEKNIKEEEYGQILDLVDRKPDQEYQLKCDFKTEDVKKLITRMPNWKAPGNDMIYGFFLKKFESVHEALSINLLRMINSGQEIEKWLEDGRTILLDKGGERSAKNMRPISLLNTTYKLYTKLISELLYKELHNNNYFGLEQLGTFKQTQAAKEQHMFSKCLEKRDRKKKALKAWIDVSKAFDSVDHEFVLRLIWKLPIPDFLKKALTSIIHRTETTLTLGGKKIGKIQLERGIRQGDSLSPLLFVTVMQAITNLVNSKTKKDKYIVRPGEVIEINHLLYIDDIKIITKKEDELAKIVTVFKEGLAAIGMQINVKKSASSIEFDPEFEHIKDDKYYKYLGIRETDRNCEAKMKRIVIEEIVKRVDHLSVEPLSGKNLFKVINEYALSKLYYYIGPLEWSEGDMKEVDKRVRLVLMKNGAQKRLANKERLYLRREDLGRGLLKASWQEENVLLGLRAYFFNEAPNSRQKMIGDALKRERNRISTVGDWIKEKHGLDVDADPVGKVKELLKVRRKEELMEVIRNKKYHSELYRDLNLHGIDKSRSAMWLTKGLCNARTEAWLCFLQDGNMFKVDASVRKCPCCGKSSLDVKHLATRCPVALHTGYKTRHDEIVKYLTMKLALQLGMAKSKKYRKFEMQEVFENRNGTILLDKNVKCLQNGRYLRPDIVFQKKNEREGKIIEVGVSNPSILRKNELDKGRKYHQIAIEMSEKEQYRIEDSSFVIGFNGLVAVENKRKCSWIGLNDWDLAWCQFLTLHSTLKMFRQIILQEKLCMEGDKLVDKDNDEMERNVAEVKGRLEEEEKVIEIKD